MIQCQLELTNYENSSINTEKADLRPRSYSIQGFSGRFTNRNRTDYLKTPESTIYRRQGEENNYQYPQNDPDLLTFIQKY